MMVPKRQTVSLVGLVIVAQLLTFNRSAPTVSFHKTLQDIQGKEKETFFLSLTIPYLYSLLP